MMIVAKEEHEEKKLKYLGNLLGNIVFDEEIDTNLANQLIRICNKLSYGQLCLLKIFITSSKYRIISLRDKNYRDENLPKQLVPVLYEIMDLDNMHLIVNGDNNVFGLTDVNPMEITVHGLGILVYTLMELASIPNEDTERLMNILKI